MTETYCLKTVVIFFQKILSFVLSRKTINIYIDLARKYGKKNKLKLDTDFLNNGKQLGVYPKFLIFILPNVSIKDASSIRERLLRSAINKHNKQLQYVLKELSIPENFLSKQLSTVDFYILKKNL